MGMIGRWIDSLGDEQRDRIIEHPDPTYHGGWWWDSKRNCGCLVGCVVGREHGGMPGAIIVELGETVWDRWSCVGGRFPDLTSRFTPQRIWRVCKARAARRNAVVLPEPAAVEVTA